ncbi:MAG: glycosyltransferase [Janthinobacterium lividum]
MTDTDRSAQSIEASLDLYLGDVLMGWARDIGRPHEAVAIQLFLGERMVSTHRADRFRADLLDAGLGSGCYGFEIPISRALADTARRSGEAFVGRSFAEPGRDLFSLDFAEELRLPPPLRDSVAMLLDDRDVEPATTAPVQSGRPAVSPAWIEPLPGSLEAHGGRPPMFRYAEHVRLLRGLEAVFAPDVIASDFDHFTRWYLDVYNAERAPRRAPLSRDVITWLNEPVTIGGAPHSATRAMLWYMADGPHGLDALSDPDLYLRLMFWWVCERAPALNVEDCLVTPFHVDTLRQVPESWSGQQFPLSRFMEEAIRTRPSLRPFTATQSLSARVSAYMVLCTEALADPWLLRFVPKLVLERLFGGTDPLFDRLASAACAPLPGARALDRHRFRQRLWARGFDLDALTYLSIDSFGHRGEHVRLGSVAPAPRVDVQLIGPMSKVSGIAHAARMSRAALGETGLSLSCVDWALDNPQPEQGFEGVAQAVKAARVNLLHLNADLLPLVQAYGPNLGSDTYTIGFFFWELDSPAACHRLAVDLVDEIWVASEYNRACFAAWTDKPVVNVGMALDIAAPPERAAARAETARLCGAGADDFVFLTTYDSLSFAARKNPLGVVRAFQDAFEQQADVRLVIKTHNAAAISEGFGHRVWTEVRRRAEEDRRIVVVDETLPYRTVLALKAGSDCYVSLHRSEGFGFGMLEAMRIGVPVVCTDYSGNRDFCDETTAWLVGADLVGVRPDEYAHASTGHRWAEPRHAEAVAALRGVRRDGDLRRSRVAAALGIATGHYGVGATARRYADRLAEILATRPSSDDEKAAAAIAPRDVPIRKTFLDGLRSARRS